MPKGSDTAAEIHRRLAAGEPVGHIAAETGRQLSVIYHHRKGRCRCPENSAIVAVEVAPGVAVEPEPEPVTPAVVAISALTAGMSSISIAAALGVETVNPDAVDFGLGDAEIAPVRIASLLAETDALVRMRREHPGQWAVVQGRRAEVERKTREKGEVVLTHADFVDFVGRLMRYVDSIFAGEIREPRREGFVFGVHVHELIATKIPHMMIAVANLREHEVLTPWPSDTPGMVVSWEKARNGIEDCAAPGCRRLAFWKLSDKWYCDPCTLVRLERQGLVESLNGPPERETTYRGLVVSNEPGQEGVICIGCNTPEDFSVGGPHLAESRIAPVYTCARCGTDLPQEEEE